MRASATAAAAAGRFDRLPELYFRNGDNTSSLVLGG